MSEEATVLICTWCDTHKLVCYETSGGFYIGCSQGFEQDCPDITGVSRTRKEAWAYARENVAKCREATPELPPIDWRARAEKAETLNKDYEEVIRDYRQLTRELDVIMNGKEGAAKQAMLCDVVAQFSSICGNVKNWEFIKDKIYYHEDFDVWTCSFEHRAGETSTQAVERLRKQLDQIKTKGKRDYGRTRTVQ